MTLQDIFDNNPADVDKVDYEDYEVIVCNQDGEETEVDSLSYQYNSDGSKRLILYL